MPLRCFANAAAALALGYGLLPLQGAAMGMDGITQGVAPLLRSCRYALALGYGLLPFQGDSLRTAQKILGK